MSARSWAGHASEAALGYFLNPLLTVALGVVILGEPLRRLQWVAVAIGAVAAGYLTVVGGSLPWIALTLASSFALYGLIKKRVGASLPALHGLTVETAALFPVALVLLWMVSQGRRPGQHRRAAAGGVPSSASVGGTPHCCCSPGRSPRSHCCCLPRPRAGCPS